jgi:hypothetical protein
MIKGWRVELSAIMARWYTTRDRPETLCYPRVYFVGSYQYHLRVALDQHAAPAKYLTISGVIHLKNPESPLTSHPFRKTRSRLVKVVKNTNITSSSSAVESPQGTIKARMAYIVGTCRLQLPIPDEESYSKNSSQVILLKPGHGIWFTALPGPRVSAIFNFLIFNVVNNELGRTEPSRAISSTNLYENVS